MPPRDNQQAIQELLRGLNTMQAQAGLMPGGMQAQMPVQPLQGPRPSDASERLRLQFFQQQQMITPIPPMGSMAPHRRPTPLERGMFMTPTLPPPQFGSGMMMGRQVAAGSVNEDIAMAQAGLGLGMRGAANLGLAGIGGLATAPLGGFGAVALPAAFEHFGGGQALQNFGSRLAQPLVNQRRNALQLQNMSVGRVVGGQDLSMSGMGLSMTAAQQLSNSLMDMADSRGFQKETGGRFNRQDVMKITQLANDMGMLDQSQSADQIKESISKVSKALSNFMKIAEEPDVRQAMRMMGQMRTLGMGIQETSLAAQNARMFARMAGTDVQNIMASGMQGAGTFQQFGLSGAAGLQAGMAATGFSRQLAATMDPRRLSLAGGQQGIAQNLTMGAAQAGTLDVMLPGMLQMRNGQLAADPEAIMRMASGEMNISDAVRSSQANMQRFGVRRTMMELSSRRRELQDEIQTALGPQGQIMLPLIQARMMMQQVPGMTLSGALRTQGMGEQQARTFEQLASSPEFWNSMRRQRQIQIREQQDEVARAREDMRDVARTPNILRAGDRNLRRLQDKFIDQPFDRFTEWLGEDQEFREMEEASGRSLVRGVRASRLDTDVQRAAGRDMLRAGRGDDMRRRAVVMLSAGMRGVEAQEQTGADLAQIRQRSFGFGIGAGIVGNIGTGLIGPDGFSPTQAGRGGEFIRETVARHGGLGERIREVGLLGAGSTRTEAQVLNRAREMREAGRVAEQSTLTGRRATEAARAARGRVRSINNDDSYENAVNTAALAVNKVLDERGPNVLGISGATPSMAELKNAALQDLIREGYTQAQAQEVVDNAMPQIVARGAAGRSPDAEATFNEMVEAGAAADLGLEGGGKAAMRRRADRLRETVMHAIGVRTDLLGGVGRDEQRGILDAISGTGEEAQARQLAFAKRALQARVAANPEDRAAQRRLAEVSGRLEAMGDVGVDAASAVDTRLGDVDEATLAAAGARFGRSNIDELTRGLATAGSEAGLIQAGALGKGYAELLGGQEEARRIMAIEDPAERLAAVEARMGELGDRERERLRGIMGGEDTPAGKLRALDEAALNEGGGMGAEGAVAGGLSQLAGLVGMDSAMSGLQAFFTGPDRAGGAAGSQTPATFEAAVGTFSEASDKLLRATEGMGAAAGLASVGSVLTAGSTVNAGITGFGLRFGLLSGLFGGGGSGGSRGGSE